MPLVVHANCPPCQLSSMTIFRMPVFLHANCPHANCPHANSPHANSPATFSYNIRQRNDNLYIIYIYMFIIY